MNYPTEIISKYTNGESTVQLSKEYGIHPSCIRTFLIDNGVKMRSNKENSRRYYVNDNVFHIIDTEEKAYWLGFLAADGYVCSTNGKRVGLSIASKDRHHLEKFKSFLCSTYPIKTYISSSGYSNSEYVRMIICSDQMYDDLVLHGVVEHKTNILKYPTSVPHELQKHFLRGFVDGDGCITKRGNSFVISIMGINEFLDDAVKYLRSENAYKHGRIYQRKKNCPTLSLSMCGETAKNVIGLLYGNCTVYLDRKYDIATRAIAYYSRL